MDCAELCRMRFVWMVDSWTALCLSTITPNLSSLSMMRALGQAALCAILRSDEQFRGDLPLPIPPPLPLNERLPLHS